MWKGWATGQTSCAARLEEGIFAPMMSGMTRAEQVTEWKIFTSDVLKIGASIAVQCPGTLFQ